MGQRLGIAAALWATEVLLFDEPVNAWTPRALKWVRGPAAACLAGEGRTVHLLTPQR